MDVYWLEQNQADLPAHFAWLSRSEADRFQTFHFAKRRMDWLLGRWTGKLAVATHLGLSHDDATLRDIEIVAAPSGAPEIFVSGKLLDIAVSLSHSGDAGVCALSNSGRALGCDLEQIEPRGELFAAEYFTADEQALVGGAASDDERWRMVALLWSAKESALKALRAGLRLDTRCVRVILEPYTTGPSGTERDWLPMRVHYTAGQLFRGWWRESGNLVQTLVGDPAPNQPIEYRVPIGEYRASMLSAP